MGGVAACDDNCAGLSACTGLWYFNLVFTWWGFLALCISPHVLQLCLLSLALLKTFSCITNCDVDVPIISFLAWWQCF